MDPVGLMGRVVELSHSSLEVEERLRLILQFVNEALFFDLVTLYSLDADRRILYPVQSNRGKPFVAGSGTFAFDKGIVGACAVRQTPIWVDGSKAEETSRGQWRRDFPGYSTLVTIPVMDDRSLLGVLLLLKSDPRALSAEEVVILSIVGRELAGVLRNDRLQSDLHGRVKELTALCEISRAAEMTLELEPLLDVILKTAVQVMGAKRGTLRVLDEQTKTYRVVSTFGRTNYSEQSYTTGFESDCEVIRTGRPFLMKEAEREKLCRAQIDSNIATCLCVPLEQEGKIVGVLSLLDKEDWIHGKGASFTAADIDLLQTMAGYMTHAVARAIQHRRIEQLVVEKESMLRELAILHETSAAMMKAIEMDRLLRVILMGITLREGLGFSRAMLFLVNEEKDVLEGRLGVGPTSAAEAKRIWADISRHRRSLGDWLNWVLEEGGEWGGKVRGVARHFRVPLDQDDCILIQALREKKAIRMTPQDDLLGIERLRSLELGPEFACVPVMSRGEALGVILVDNLYSLRPIGDEDLRMLMTFASQAGLAIQNAMLYESLKRANLELQTMQLRLIQSEKLAALGEFAASMAHEIRNPLVSIGGYARLLEKKHRTSYSRIISEEVERLEGILNEVLAFSRGTPDERKEEDLNMLLESVLRTLRGGGTPKGVKIQREFTQSLPRVSCDTGQIKQVLLNLIHNALETIGNRGTLTIRTYLSSGDDGVSTVAEVSDTGGGIPPHIIQNIFNPFFTTKEQGTGLGLAITQRIVEAHGGRIEVDNRPGEGSTFRVKLPAAV